MGRSSLEYNGIMVQGGIYFLFYSLLCLCLMLSNHLRWSYNVMLASMLSTFVLMHIAYILTKCRVEYLIFSLRIEFQEFRRLNIFVSPQVFEDNIHLLSYHLLLCFRLYVGCVPWLYSFHSLMVWDNTSRKTSSFMKYFFELCFKFFHIF